MTPWVKRLLVTNVIVALVLQPGTLLYALLTLFPPAVVGLDQVYIPELCRSGLGRSSRTCFCTRG